MRCVVTAGPTFEPLDEARRLTNFSTGRLGIELANHLTEGGHTVTLFVGEQSTWTGSRRAGRVEVFTTAEDLQQRLRALAAEPVDAVFHAAAVSDFGFGKIWARSSDGQLLELESRKISTRHGRLLAELLPTPKILPHLRIWFPLARLVGWKYEVEGTRDEALGQARQQIEASRTDACVANGPACGPGFVFLTREGAAVDLPDRNALLAELARWLG